MLEFLKRNRVLRQRLEQRLVRCMFCGRLLGREMIRQGTCAGHRVHITGEVTFWEFCKLLMGRIQ